RLLPAQRPRPRPRPHCRGRRTMNRKVVNFHLPSAGQFSASVDSLTTSMRTPGGEVVDGRWGKSATDGCLSDPLAAHDVAVLRCCTAVALVFRCRRVPLRLDAVILTWLGWLEGSWGGERSQLGSGCRDARLGYRGVHCGTQH